MGEALVEIEQILRSTKALVSLLLPSLLTLLLSLGKISVTIPIILQMNSYGNPMASFDSDSILENIYEKLTQEEEHVLQSCKARAVRDFTFSACLASGITWTATRRLAYSHRFNLSSGAAILFGLWRFDRTLDQILALEGTRMQRELVKLILTKYQDDPWRMQLVKKHFYSEKVFDDANPEKPLSRWRQRHFFGDTNDHRPREDEERTFDDKTNSKHDDSNELKRSSESCTPKEIPKTSEDFVPNPLDYILRFPGTEGESSESASPSPKRRNRAHRRLHRKNHLPHNLV